MKSIDIENNIFVKSGKKDDLFSSIRFNDFYSVNIEFEIKNIDTIIDINEPKQLVERIKEKFGLESRHKSSKSRPTEDNELGSFLLEILNNYNILKKTLLCNYMKMSNKSKDIWNTKNTTLKNEFKDDDDKYIKEKEKIDEELFQNCYLIFEKLLDKVKALHPKLSIFELYSLDYMKRTYEDYKNDIKYLKAELIKLNNALHHYEENTKLHIGIYNTIKETEKKLEEKDNIDYLLHQLATPVARYIDEWFRAKQLIENTFIHSDKTRNNKFSGIHTLLPATNIEYKADRVKYPIPFRYTYEITYIDDLVNVTIYQLILNHKVIIKCKNCGKYLIPDRTDKIYCDNEDDCKFAYNRRKHEENCTEAYKYYRKLYNRYKNTKSYSKELEELKSIYYNKYRTKQIDDDTFMNILLDFEQNVKNNNPLKRGRPSKRK